jgi:hypothetical protein
VTERDRPTPDVFEVYIGSFGAASYGIWWDGKQLVYESFVSGYEDRRQVYVSPSSAQWARFWRTMESIDVWSWKDRYEPGGRFEPKTLIRDGTHWSVSLQHDGRRVESAGERSARGTNKFEASGEFELFADAVSRLTGGYQFT